MVIAEDWGGFLNIIMKFATLIVGSVLGGPVQMQEQAVSCAAHTVSSGGARCVRAVPLMLWAAASSVLEEPGVSGQSRSHRQFWGSQVCPGGSAHGVDGRLSGFPYFLQFKSEFGNKEFMI